MDKPSPIVVALTLGLTACAVLVVNILLMRNVSRMEDAVSKAQHASVWDMCTSDRVDVFDNSIWFAYESKSNATGTNTIDGFKYGRDAKTYAETMRENEFPCEIGSVAHESYSPKSEALPSSVVINFGIMLYTFGFLFVGWSFICTIPIVKIDVESPRAAATLRVMSRWLTNWCISVAICTVMYILIVAMDDSTRFSGNNPVCALRLSGMPPSALGNQEGLPVDCQHPEESMAVVYHHAILSAWETRVFSRTFATESAACMYTEYIKAHEIPVGKVKDVLVPSCPSDFAHELVFISLCFLMTVCGIAIVSDNMKKIASDIETHRTLSTSSRKYEHPYLLVP